MFSKILIQILRKWQKNRGLVAFYIHSQGEHTETSVLLDDSGSAYQIAVRASGLYLCPQVTVSEYIIDTQRVLHQESSVCYLFSFASALDRALARVHAWMADNGAHRLPQTEEMRVVERMYSQIGSR